MLTRILNALGLGKIGLLEIFLALFVILSGYKYGSFIVAIFLLVIMDIIAINKRQILCKLNNKYLHWLIIYIVFHEFFLWISVGLQNSFIINRTIEAVIYLVSILIIYPKVDNDKLYHSLMWVTYFVSAGLIFHFVQLQAGQAPTPIKLPFFPEMATDTRMFEEQARPSSFFWEPAAAIIFLMVPFYITLIKRNYVISFFIMLMMLLTGSTNGIVLSAVLLLIYIFTQEINFKYKLLILLLGIGTFVLMFTSNAFEAGVNKLQSQDYGENVRLMNGIIIASNTDFSELILGVPAADLYDYVKLKNIPALFVYDDLFVPTFWNVLLRYGIIGLFLWLCTYVKIIKNDRLLLPYIGMLVVSSIAQSISPGGAMYTFQMIIALSFCNHKINIRNVRLKQ